MCCVVKNEASYLLEHFFWHQLQGVEHAYYYESGSTDNTVAILKKLEAKGLATVYDNCSCDPYLKNQMGCYDHYLENHRKESTWTAYVDLDELLFSPQGQLLPILNDVKGSALAVAWVIYGSNGLVDYDPRLVIERFTRRSATAHSHVKSICYNDETIKAGANPHEFELQDYAVDENNFMLPKHYAISDKRTMDKIRIAHFHTKSKNEYIERRKHRFTPPEIEERFKQHDCNEVEDLSLTMFAPVIKTMIEKFNNE